jgi:peptidoglycan/xylan/chitin deacetylase (PgdA/CDA1 family)
MVAGRPPPLALAYHGVADVALRDDPRGLFVRPRDVVRHISRLRAWTYRLVCFGELAELARGGEAAGHAALTFDDGLADNLETLVPLLADAGVPATVFVVSGWLGKPHPEEPRGRIMSSADVRELAAAGIEIGAHTETHPDLTELSYSAVRGELARCKATLEEIVTAPVRVAAYPYGLANAQTIAACAEVGFQAACTNSGRGSWNEPHYLPRQDINNGTTMLGLRLRRDGRYERLMSHATARALRSLTRRTRAALDV